MANKRKRSGETLAKALARERAEKEAFGRQVGMEVGRQQKQLIANDLMKIFVIAANDAWGIGNKRLRDFVDAVYAVSCDFDKLACGDGENDEPDYEYARTKMDERIQQIFGDEPVEFRLRY